MTGEKWCEERGCRRVATHPTTAPTYCLPHNEDTVLRLRRCYAGLEARIFDAEAPPEWDIENRETRAWVKSLMGAALDAAYELERWRKGEVAR